MSDHDDDHEVWSRVDEYYGQRLVGDDDTLSEALRANASAGLPPIDVTPATGKLLHLLARSVGARRILEVGTLGGYSTIWLAKAVPSDGEVVTCEVSPRHAEVARANLDRAGVGDRVRIVLGPALETLPGVEGPFDMVFVDADKVSNAEYLDHAIRLSRPGALVVVDNVVRGGRVVDETDDDPAVVGTRRLADALAADPRISATMVQTVASKGYDGFVLGVVES
ncbi:MAG: O-methyltransferase [Pseudonocardia sp.]|uniref:O-methyltransferase n=1 Tax=unclassified Pseudonocardia TaxID=2619320 RepID=UPI0008698A25|nr:MULTISPECIES: O-methyltransferase [unclassified Pseudonocardia]MBN9110531.1 O-methyltransferase [Pseudonocardia sp.]ODU19093.1 MAG: methyltransferase [Pseudonocardia sp. SCN 72-51]ODV00693.1 MAG: methyltransferase [Pseudonocardia sp. SCN 73-27]